MKVRCTAMFAGPVATVAVLILFAMSQHGFAQSTSGRVLGSVSDQSGAAVAGATVVVTDTERGTSRTLTTDASRATYVAAGPTLRARYMIRVEDEGLQE